MSSRNKDEIINLKDEKQIIVSYIFKNKYNLITKNLKNNFILNINNFNYFLYIIIILCFLIIFISINKQNKLIEIDIDNQINISKYEDNIDFTNYSTNIMAIALYLPIYYPTKNDDCFLTDSSYWKIIQNKKTLYKGHHQPRKPGDKKNYLYYYDLTKPEVIKKQVKLAKIHGIYGFAIYYYLFNGKRLFYKPLDIYLNNKDINFPFFLILRNENQRIKCKKKTKIININCFIENIKIFLIDTRYIKIKEKLLIGIYEPIKIKNLKNIILIWRKKAKEIKLGELFILANLNTNNYNYSNIFNGIYDYPPFNLEKKKLLKYKKLYYYPGLIYNINSKLLNNNKTNFTIYYSSITEWDNSALIKDYFIFNDFSPEKFYLLNKLLIEWTNKHYIEDKIIILNSWNNWIEGSYLEPDEKYGYSSINSLSKALFNLQYKKINITNILYLFNHKKIAVQAHIFYEDLINEIINKTNNIPINFDLYITTTSLDKKKVIQNYIEEFSKSNYYNIKIIENRGRDVLPMLIQLKNIIKKYKYICHIHSKKTIYNPKYGNDWRQYLYENLLGSNEIIGEILFDFEYFNKLGFIFPETFYESIRCTWNIKHKHRNNINYLLNIFFPGFKMGKKLDYPAGNMFWAKVDAIYQIFDLTIYSKFPEEKKISPYTIMHGIERIWLYLVKLNGYVYKKIFKHL